MTRKNTSRTVRNKIEELQENSTPLDISDEDSSAPLDNSESLKLRTVSLKQAAILLDRDRNTIMKWLEADCPYVRKADRKLGIPWELDIAEVVRWLEKRAANASAGKSGSSHGAIMSKDAADERRAIANAVITETEMLEKLHIIVPVSFVTKLLEDDYSQLKGAMMSVPDAIAGRVDISIAQIVKRIAEEQVRAALGGCKARAKFEAYLKG